MADGLKVVRSNISTWLNRLSAFIYPDNQPLPRNTPSAITNSSETPQNCGSRIFDAGWRQGTFISLDAVVLPGKLQSTSDIPYVVICSQSCTVVLPDLIKDPYVELIVARPIPQHNPRSPEATGKNQRTLHLQIEEGADFPALELSINDRFEMPRAHLLKFNSPYLR